MTALPKYLAAFILVCSALFTSSAWSVIELNEFPDELTKERYQDLIDELRCPKCQNQNLTDSNAQIAIDLRKKVRTLIEEGKSDDEIKSHLVARYGDFVLYRPEVKSETFVLWYAPAVLLGLGFLSLIIIVLNNRRKSVNTEASGSEASVNMSDDEREQQVKRLLEQNSRK